MRWRAEHSLGGGDWKTVGGHERAQSQFLFKRDTASGLIHVTFPLVHEGKHLLYEGTQLPKPAGTVGRAGAAFGVDYAEDQDNTAIQEAMGRVKSEWKRLFNPRWEERPLSDTDIEVQRGGGEYIPSRGHNHWERPQTGTLIYARNKPGPNPGFRANLEGAGSKLIEERPGWAWDVTGKYVVTSPEFDNIVNGPEAGSRKDDLAKWPAQKPPPDFQMTIWLENNRWHSKVGRQYWAEFAFGESRGTMRFCPGPVADELFRTDTWDIESFESACILEPGVWPGTSDEKGTLEWGMRWRGFHPCMGMLDGDSSDITFVRFTRSPEGELSLSGTMFYGSEKIMFIGQKFGTEGAERSGQAVTVSRAWKQYQPRAISLVDYMDFEEPI
ncbi:hypothetical protein Micbo1qcDRAFT_69826 [Microdochium bolleyi]|uniref:Uncharacterized protein n=1 Tax=Microdochium bolleyi TaxID=196109 RepID=A0A136J1S1_9PEZI|nr:hypothetical protein Micbo1qcDRAFT_69826 [Microdochium bolleyi]